jgi:sulfate adenylyltransferase subunit 1
MDNTPLASGKTYIVQHGINSQKAKVTSVDTVMEVEHMNESSEKTEIRLNEIGTIQVKLAGEIFADKYADNPANGAFIIVDPMTNNTAGLGFVL